MKDFDKNLDSTQSQFAETSNLQTYVFLVKIWFNTINFLALQIDSVLNSTNIENNIYTLYLILM